MHLSVQQPFQLNLTMYSSPVKMALRLYVNGFLTT